MKKPPSLEELHSSIRQACHTNIGVFENEFLCRSVGALDPSDPVTIQSGASVAEVMRILQDNRMGCVLVVSNAGVLEGIFTERDYVLKVWGVEGADAQQIEDYLTPNPITVTPEETVAYVLNLMSLGGFRHLPIVDDEKKPIGVLSVKNIVDFMVHSFTQELLDFEEES